MAGVKQTPRQQMIGIMYLVLLALLAMNASKDLLDAFIFLENGIDVDVKPETVTEENLAPVTEAKEEAPKADVAPATEVKNEEAPKAETKTEKKLENSPEKK